MKEGTFVVINERLQTLDWAQYFYWKLRALVHVVPYIHSLELYLNQIQHYSIELRNVFRLEMMWRTAIVNDQTFGTPKLRINGVQFQSFLSTDKRFFKSFQITEKNGAFVCHASSASFSSSRSAVSRQRILFHRSNPFWRGFHPNPQIKVSERVKERRINEWSQHDTNEKCDSIFTASVFWFEKSLRSWTRKEESTFRAQPSAQLGAIWVHLSAAVKASGPFFSFWQTMARWYHTLWNDLDWAEMKTSGSHIIKKFVSRCSLKGEDRRDEIDCENEINNDEEYAYRLIKTF